MKKILLIGKSGYVGNEFSRYMKAFPDHEITRISSRNCEWKKTNFGDYDVIYNVSGLSHGNAKRGTESQYYEVNGQLPIDLAEKAKADGVHHFIQMSSEIVYGDMAPLYVKKHITSETIPNPPTVYGKSKMMSERGLKKLRSDDFKVAIMRPPLIYGERAPENFYFLVQYAKKMPIFPYVPNNQSMIYIDNLCELIRLIIDNQSDGIFFPQEKNYIHTGKLIKDIAEASGHKMHLTKLFNPALMVFQKKFRFIYKALGNLTYDKSMSEHFDGKYRVVGYQESIRRIAAYKEQRN